MLKILIFFLFIASELFSLVLNDTYYVDSNNIKLFDIVPNAKYDVTLYMIDDNRYTKRIKSKDLIETLKKHGIDSVESSDRYIKFIKKSPIDTSKIELEILKIYKEKYPEIEINSIVLTPRRYLVELPEKYELRVPRKAYLTKDSIISIKTPDYKKIFFDCIIDAKIDVYMLSKNVKKGEMVSYVNTTKKNIYFDKFKAAPISAAQIDNSQYKQHMKPDSIISVRDIELLDIVKKGSFVNVNLKNENINISFSAKALQNGKLNDIITVQKSSGQKLQVKITGKNRVEMR